MYILVLYIIIIYTDCLQLIFSHGASAGGEVRIITGSPLRVDEGEQASICLELSAAVSSAATHLSSNLTVTFTIDNDEAGKISCSGRSLGENTTKTSEIDFRQ